jgi:hypothetical protein
VKTDNDFYWVIGGVIAMVAIPGTLVGLFVYFMLKAFGVE